jgi:hypothetical protein
VVGGEPVTERLVLHSLTADGFTVEHETTPDEGETWNADLRLTYARPGAEGEAPASDAAAE